MNIYDVILLIIVICVSIIAIRVSFNFDLNKYLEYRRKIRLNQLKNICPHGRVTNITDNGLIAFESFFSSPVGTLKWICSQCGLIVDHEDDINRITEMYSKNPSLILEKQKRFNKQAKKLKIV